MAIKRGLGKGLGALIKDGTTPAETPHTGTTEIPIEHIKKNRWQPRRGFDADALRELGESIREHGVLQPLLVRKLGDDEYELIAGERRLTAASGIGLDTVPAIVMDAAEIESLEIALVENLQREDLNPLDEAEGYHVLAERFDLTQEQIASRVGKARASVANSLRLLSLPDEIKDFINEGGLSAGHAKALTALDIADEQVLYARRVVKEDLSVHALERLIQKAKRAPRKPRATRTDIPAAHITDLADRLQKHFGTRVRLQPCMTYANGKKKKGSLEIDYYSPEDLDRILSLLGISGE